MPAAKLLKVSCKAKAIMKDAPPITVSKAATFIPTVPNATIKPTIITNLNEILIINCSRSSEKRSLFSAALRTTRLTKPAKTQKANITPRNLSI